jgi:SAM-dependent methyltransferase
MSGYGPLADFYDRLQQDVDYASLADLVVTLNQRYSQKTGPGDGEDGRPLLLDLGCGTGTLALTLETRGFDVIGLDQSAGMLQQAREKAQAAGSRALFLQQDISRFELYGTVDLAVCLLDTLNHLTRPDRLRRVFRLLANYLNPGALFIADVGTKRHFARTLGNRTFIQDYPDLTLIWQNQYRQQSQLSRSSLTFFQRTAGGLYERFDEEVVERYYDHTFLCQAAREAGLQYVTRTGEQAAGPPPAGSERHFYIFRRRMNL